MAFPRQIPVVAGPSKTQREKNIDQILKTLNVIKQKMTEELLSLCEKLYSVMNCHTLVTSDEESNSNEQPFIQTNENSRRWHQTSRRWWSKRENLANTDASRTYKLPALTLVPEPEFEGSDGAQVFLGLRDDGTEDVNIGYLVLELRKYTLKEYIQDHLPDDTAERTLVLKKLVKEVLCILKVLHDQQTKVLHCDIKPQNVLIVITGKARLADFGISLRLKQDETTLKTSIAGTECWKAMETINEKFNTRDKRSSDIQVAGMLVYYILSGGHHPFGEDVDCEYNISRGRYSLEHLDDDVAKDLVEWMINEDPIERPTVEQTLAHPFFWADDRRVEYIKKLGNQKEVENCRNADEELLQAVKIYTEGKSFSKWKTKLSPELVQKLDGKKKPYPENTLGLLRFIRNLHEH
ncbi:uncharacterized protein LOC127160397 isoform X2 [Labeo rohita]|nr:uncharacterized protein LOC127160397 isoform X2 [Labeo rohita]